MRRGAQDAALPADNPSPDRGGRNAGLTEREQDIVAHVARGLPNRAIAERLGIAEQTVKNHLHVIFGKLGVTSRLELALAAIAGRARHSAIDAKRRGRRTAGRGTTL